MAVAFRASATANDASTTAQTNAVFTIPATAQVGDVAVVSLEDSNAGTTMTTPTGWTVQHGPDAGTAASTSWLFSKTLASGEPGATVTFTKSSGSRYIGEMIVFSGCTDTGIVVAATTGEASGTTTVIPTLTSPANAALITFVNRRRGGTPAPTITIPAGYTSVAQVTTNFGALPEICLKGGYKAATTAGTYGGETATTDTASVGSTYLVALPATSSSAFSGTVALSGSGTLSLAAVTAATSGAVALSGSGTLSPTAVTTATSGSVPLSGSGTLSPSAPVVATRGTVATSGSGTLSALPSGTVALSGSGTLAATGVPLLVKGTLALSGSGTVAFVGKPLLVKGTLALSGTGTLTTTGLTVRSGPAFFAGTGTLSVGGTRTNLVLNPSGNVNLTNWVANQSTAPGTFTRLTGITGQPFTTAVDIVQTAVARTWSVYENFVGVGMIAGRQYTLSLYAKSVSGTATSGPVAISDGSGLNGVFTGGAAITMTTSWQRFSWTFTAAIDSLSTSYVYIPIDPNAATEFQLGGMLLETGGLKSYFAGDSTRTSTDAYSWSGTAGGSTSVDTMRSAAKFIGTAATSATGTLTLRRAIPIYQWTGSAWAPLSISRWNGTSWVTTTATLY